MQICSWFLPNTCSPIEATKSFFWSSLAGICWKVSGEMSTMPPCAASTTALAAAMAGPEYCARPWAPLICTSSCRSTPDATPMRTRSPRNTSKRPGPGVKVRGMVARNCWPTVSSVEVRGVLAWTFLGIVGRRRVGAALSILGCEHKAGTLASRLALPLSLLKTAGLLAAVCVVRILMMQRLSCLPLPGSDVLDGTSLLPLCSVSAFEVSTPEEEVPAVKGDSSTGDDPNMPSGDARRSARTEFEGSPSREIWSGRIENREGKRLTRSAQSSPVSLFSLRPLFRSPLLVAVLSRAASKASSPLDFPLCWQTSGEPLQLASAAAEFLHVEASASSVSQSRSVLRGWGCLACACISCCKERHRQKAFSLDRLPPLLLGITRDVDCAWELCHLEKGCVSTDVESTVTATSGPDVS
mmetsp:Transcript_23183/g.60426  ORF Transcript_23183/g.60426 Transcript_23183/m.60426 type:complete len:412 (+) Transcript_23183:2199-3434(+)